MFKNFCSLVAKACRSNALTSSVDRRRSRLGVIAPAALAVIAAGTSIPRANAAAFTPGNLVLLRVAGGATGAGEAALAGTATTVYLDEYTPTGTFVQTISFPTSGANKRIMLEGTSSTTGYLNVSSDGAYFTLGGYDLAVGATTTTAGNTRVLGRVNMAGVVDSSTSNTTMTGNLRSVTSDGTNFWAGLSGGVSYEPYGSSTVTSLATPTSRCVQINGAQLYVSTSTAINTVGSGLPIASATVTALPGLAGSGANDYFVANATTIYVADDGAVTGSSVGGVQKWVLVGATWTRAYIINAGLPGGLMGLAGRTNAQGNVVLYATQSTSATGGNNAVLTAVDFGSPSTSTFTPLPTALLAGTNKAFKGIRIVPGAAACSAPTVSAPTGTAVCAGTTTNISVTASGGTIGYQWQLSTNFGFTWANVASAGNAATYAVPITATSNTLFRCVVTNECGSTVSSSISPVPAPATPIPGTGTIGITAGQSVTLTASIGAGETLAWYSTSCGVGPVPAGAGTVAAPVVSPTVNTTYFARATNATGCVSAACGTITVVVTAPPPIVISQVYSQGNLTGATYKNSYIELFNRTSSPVSLVGYSIQNVNAATGTTWTKNDLTGSIPANGYWLIRAGTTDGTGTTALVPDASFSTLSMSSTAGKLALVASTTLLPSASCHAPGSNAIVDMVGWSSTVDCYEGSGPGPACSTVLAIFRADSGCTDTNNSNLDFAAALPAPRNSAITNTCPATGACCLTDGTCIVTTSALCTSQGGSFGAVGSVCPQASYVVTNRTAALDDISTQGATSIVPVGDDNNSGSLALPFTFKFFGAPRTNYLANANGHITFATATTGTLHVNAVFPTAGVPNELIAPYWDDLYVVNNTNNVSAVLALTKGTAPYRVFIIQWNRMDHTTPATITTSTNTFQLLLYETSNAIEFRYGAIVPNGATYAQASATGSFNAGIENGNGLVGYDIPPAFLGVGGPSAAKLFLPTANTCVNANISCCLGATCQQLTLFECQAANGTPQPTVVMCTPDPCAQDACCLPNNTCVNIVATACASQGGQYNPGQVCNPTPACAVGGSCCTGTTCTVTFAGGCGSGDWVANGSCPMANRCGGACCNTATGVCFIETAALCTGGSLVWNGATSTTCTTNPCPPPSNDECAGAIALSTGLNPIRMLGATTSTTPAQCNASFTRDVWFSYTATCPGTLTVTNCGQAPAGYDTVMTLYSGACGSAAVVSSQCNDGGGSCGLNEASVSASVAAGTYLIRVGIWTTVANLQNTTLNVTFVASVPNDACSGAVTVDGSSGTATVNTSNTCATDDGLTPSCGATSKDLWYKLTPGAAQSGLWTIDTVGSAIDTILSVYTGACPGTEVACNDDSSGITSSVSLALTGGTQYLVRVASKGVTAGGAITLNFNGPPANNDCGNATSIALSTTTGVVINTAGNSTFASLDGPATASCPNTAVDHDVWFTITPAVTATYRFSTCGASFDTGLEAFTGACGALVAVGCNDNFAGCAPGGTGSQLDLPVISGNTYRLRVYSHSPGGTFTLAGVLLPPPNDECTGAQAIAGPFTPTAVDVTSTFTGATAESNPVGVSGGVNGTFPSMSTRAGVWYKVVGTGTTLTASLCPTGVVYDTIMQVLCGTCDGMTSVGNGDGECTTSTGHARVSWCATSGTTYYIWVAPFSGNATATFTLRISDDATPCMSTVACGGCTIIPPGGATAESENPLVASNTGATSNALCDGGTGTVQALGPVGVGSPASAVAIARASNATPALASDIDYFTFTVAANGVYRLSGQAGFPANVQLRDLGAGAGTCPGTPALVTLTPDTCVAFSTAFTNDKSLVVGNTYAVRVTPNLPSTQNGGWNATGPASGYYFTVAAAPSGACCTGSGCTISAQVLCTGTYLGDNTTCPTPPTSIDPVAAYCADSVPSSVTFTVNGGGGTGTTLEVFSGSCGVGPVAPISQSGNQITIAAPSTTTTYAVRWAGPAGCGATSCVNVTVTVQPTPVANAGSAFSICAGSTATLDGTLTNASGASAWAVVAPASGTFANANDPDTIYTPSPADILAGSVTLRLTAAPIAPCATASTSDVTITIQAAPIANAGGNLSTCQGVPKAIGGSFANGTALWSGGTGSFLPNNTGPTVYTPGLGETGDVVLTLTVTGIGPCTTPAVSQMTLHIEPAATANAGSNFNWCTTSPVALNGSSFNNNGTTWSSTTGGTFANASMLITTYTPSALDLSNGSVSLKLTATGNAPCGNVESTVVVTLVPPPTANAGSDISICSNNNAAQNVFGLASNNASVLWTTSGTGKFDNDTNVSSTNATTNYTPSAADKLAGSITLTFKAVANSPCTDAVDTLVLTTTPAPVVDAGPATAVTCELVALSLTSASASNHSGLQWTVSPPTAGTFTAGTSLVTDFVPASGFTGPAILTLTATGNAPCANAQDTIGVTVNPAPGAPTTGSGSMVCAGAPTTVTATAGPGEEIVWFTGAGPCGATQVFVGSPFTVNPIVTTTYYARARTIATQCLSLGCASETVTVTSGLPAPTGVSAGPTMVCQGSTSILTGTVGAGEVIDWYTGSCGGTFIGSGTGSPTNTFAVNPIADTTYYGRARNTTAGCTSPMCTSVTVTVKDTPAIPTLLTVTPSNQQVCAGGSFTAVVATPPINVQIDWYAGGCDGMTGTLVGNSPSLTQTVFTTTTYYARARYTDGTLCPSQCVAVTITVNQLPTPPINVMATTNPVCAGAGVTLSAVATGANETLHWYVDSCGGTPVGTGNSVFVAPTSTKTYFVNAFNNTTGCSDGCASITINVNPAPADPTLTGGGSTAICTGGSFNLAPTASASGGATIDWFTACGPLTAPGTPLGSTTVSPASTTTYFARAKSAQGCYSVNCVAFTVTVNQGPTANAGGPSNLSYGVCAGGTSVQLLSATASNYNSLAWTTSGDGTFAPSNSTLNATYNLGTNDLANPGTPITLTLTATPLPGCASPAVSMATLQQVSPTSGQIYADIQYSGLPVGTLVTWPRIGGTGAHVIGCDAFGTLQAAVNALPSSGGTVHVAPGTYPEYVLVSTNNTVLLGANFGADPRLTCPGPGTRGPESVIDGLGIETAIAFNANNCVLDGFTVRGGAPGPDTLNSGVYIFGAASGTIIRNNFIRQNTIGVAPYGPNTTISKNVFDANADIIPPAPSGGAGIYVDGATTNLVIDNNEFKNHVDNNPIIFAATAPAIHSNLQFTNNDVHDNAYGVYVLSATNSQFKGNRFSTTGGLATGLAFASGNLNVAVSENIFGLSLRGVRVDDDGYGFGPNTGVHVNGNKFVGPFTTFAVGSTAAGGHTEPAVDASNNWWGSNLEASITPLIAGSASPVDYSPWLNFSTDFVAGDCTGFQGDFSHLIVSSASPRSNASLGWIQEGIDSVADGSFTAGNRIVQALPGTFKENPVANKPVTIRGNNVGTAGGDPRIAESAIVTNGNNNHVVLVTANNVTIDGMTIDGDDPMVVGNPVNSGADANTFFGVSNYIQGSPGTTFPIQAITLRNNIIKHTAMGFRANGVLPLSGPVYTSVGNLITRNWFDDIGVFDFGYAVSIRYHFYADVTDNKITKTWTGVHTSVHSNAGPALWSISNNNMQVYGCGVASWGVDTGAATGATISSNQIALVPPSPAFIHPNNTGILVFYYQGPKVTVSNNTITGMAYGITVSGAFSTGPNVASINGNTITSPGIAGVNFTNNLIRDVTPAADALTINHQNPVGTTDLNLSGAGYTLPVFLNINGLTINGAVADGITETMVGPSTSVATLSVTNTHIDGVAASDRGVLVSGANAKASIINNPTTMTGFDYGILVDGGSALVQTTNLNGNNIAGIQAQNGATVDAGDCGATNFTGLGSSTGGNTLTGYLPFVTAYAIRNLNSGSPVVLAHNNNFTAGPANIATALDQSGAPILFSNSTFFFACPPNILTGVECLSQVPAGATSVAAFIAAGGTVSSNTGTVSFLDAPVSPYLPYPASPVNITRTYTVSDGCHPSQMCAQTIHLEDVTNPMISAGVLPAVCYASVAAAQTAAEGVTTASDNCVTVSLSSSTVLGCTSTITVTATDASGRTASVMYTGVAIATYSPTLTGPASAGACVGGSVSFSVSGFCPGSTFQWRYNGAPIADGPSGSGSTYAGTGSATLMITGVTAADTTFPYDVVVTGPAPCLTVVTSGTATLSVISGPTTVYVDDGYVGLPNGTLVNWPYTGAGTHIIGCDASATIQGGIGLVASGGTVNVAAGTYSETALTLNKSISLLGPQAGVSACGRSVASEAIVSPAVAADPALLIDGSTNPSGIIIDGFTFRGSTNLFCVRLENGTAPNMQFLNNRVREFTGGGVFWNRSVNNGLSAGNEVDGTSQTGNAALFQLDGADAFHGFRFNNNCLINGNTGGTGLFCDGNHNWTSLAPATQPPTITGNLISGCGTGANLGSRSFGNASLASPTATISLNSFLNNDFDGLQGGFQNTDVKQNTFQGNGRSGLALTSFGNTGADRGAQNANIFENCFSGNGIGAPNIANCDVLFSSTQGAGTIGTNHLNRNSLGSAVAVVYNEAVPAEEETIDCSNNWWGNSSGPTVAVHPSGTGNQIAGAASHRIDFTPWLDLGTDTSGTCTNGFQGDLSKLHVDDDSIQFGATTRIQEGVNSIADGSLIGAARLLIAERGTYTENPTINKALILQGPNVGIAGNGARGSEATIITNGNQSVIVTVTAAGVTIDGVKIDGDDTAVAGGPLYAGDDSNAAHAIRVVGAFGNLTVRNNIIARVGIGVRGDALSQGNLITKNWFDRIGNFDFGYAVSLRSNFYADVKDNLMTKCWTGVHTNNINGPVGPATWTISGNEMHTYAGGIMYWLVYNGATGLTIDNNDLSAETGSPAAVANNFGILIVSNQNAVASTITNNDIVGHDYGVGVTNASTSNFITLGSTNTITGPKVAGVLITNHLSFNPVGTTNLNTSVLGYVDPMTVNLTGLKINGAVNDGVVVTALATSTVRANITANTHIDGLFGAGSAGVAVEGATASASILNNLTTMTGFTYGIDVDGGAALIENNTLTGNTDAAIHVINGALVDAGDCSGSNISGLGTGTGLGGSSAGNNNLSGYGFDIGPDSVPVAVFNQNIGAPNVRAQNNNYGAGSGDDINDTIIDIADNAALSRVFFSQTGGQGIQTPPAAQSVCVGDTATFMVVANGSGLTYEWFYSTTAMGAGMSLGNNSPTLTITNVQLSHVGFYWVKVTDTCNAMVESARAQLSVTPPPSVDAGGPYTICSDGVVLLAGMASNVSGVTWTIVDGPAGMVGDTTGWGFFHNNAILGAIYTPGALAIAQGSVTLKLTGNAASPCLGMTMDTALVTINPLPVAPTAAFSSDNNFCAGSLLPNQISLTATGGSGAKLAWSAGSCNGPIIGSGSPFIVSPAPTTTTTYYARWINSCGNSGCASVVVTVNPLPAAPTSPSAATTICAGSSTTISAVVPSGFTIDWFSVSCGGTPVPGGAGTSSVLVTPASTTSYFARARDLTTGCVSATCAGPIVITVTPIPTDLTSISAVPNIYCSNAIPGGGITLSASGGTGGVIKWYTGSCGGTPVPGGTGSPIVIPAPSSDTTYYARREDGSCNSPGCLSVFVDVVPAPTVSAGPAQLICSNGFANLDGSAANDNGVQWSKPMTADGTFGSPTSQDTTYTPGPNDIAAGSVVLTLTALGNGPCANTSSNVTVTITTAPSVNAGPDSTICSDTFATLSGTSSNSSQVTWTGGTGSFGNIHSATTTYTPGVGESGPIVLTLTATGNNPCVGSPGTELEFAL